MHRDMEMETWKHGEIETWRHGDMDMETWIWRQGHGDMDNGHGDIET
jgi:hypothetical protein